LSFKKGEKVEIGEHFDAEVIEASQVYLTDEEDEELKSVLRDLQAAQIEAFPDLDDEDRTINLAAYAFVAGRSAQKSVEAGPVTEFIGTDPSRETVTMSIAALKHLLGG